MKSPTIKQLLAQLAHNLRNARVDANDVMLAQEIYRLIEQAWREGR